MFENIFKHKQPDLEIVAVVDRSGSMGSIRSEAIKGFNKFLEEHQTMSGNVIFTLIQFDDEIDVVYNGKNVSKVKPYTSETYIPRGSTALYDAVGYGIEKAEERGTDRKVIFAILTDGMENASRKYNSIRIKDMISKCKNAGWAFIFLAAGFDQHEAEFMSSDLGISADHTMGFTRDSIGASFSCASSATRSYSASGKVGIDWKKH